MQIKSLIEDFGNLDVPIARVVRLHFHTRRLAWCYKKNKTNKQTRCLTKMYFNCGSFSSVMRSCPFLYFIADLFVLNSLYVHK